MAQNRRVTDLFGIEEPILQGPFGGASSVALTAAVSNAGGLGGFGLYGYDARRIDETTRALRTATSRPFNLNLWLPMGDEVEPAEVDWAAATAPLRPLFEAVDVPVPERPTAFLPDFESQFAAVLEARPAALSLVFGAPTGDIVERAHAADILVVGTATTVAEALALEAGGVDAVIASGSDAGGHRVSFLRTAEDSTVGTFSLVPAVVDAVSVPVIAAGGIGDRRAVAAAFALGADGVLAGTAFFGTRESAAPASHRAALRDVPRTGTTLTRAMSGRLSRGVRNAAVDLIENGAAVAPFPAQNWLTGRFRAAASQLDRADLLSLWSGQGGSRFVDEPAAVVFDELRTGVPR